jgi:transcriptional antiterminator NusG
LFRQLKKVIGLTKLIGVGDDIVALTDKEEAFLEQFGDKEQIVRMSEGIIENSEIIVTSGPLKGLEGYIRKIDRHKRKAWLELPLFGGMQRVEVGLEIIVKK